MNLGILSKRQRIYLSNDLNPLNRIRVGFYVTFFQSIHSRVGCMLPCPIADPLCSTTGHSQGSPKAILQGDFCRKRKAEKICSTTSMSFVIIRSNPMMLYKYSPNPAAPVYTHGQSPVYVRIPIQMKSFSFIYFKGGENSECSFLCMYTLSLEVNGGALHAHQSTGRAVD